MHDNDDDGENDGVDDENDDEDEIDDDDGKESGDGRDGGVQAGQCPFRTGWPGRAVSRMVVVAAMAMMVTMMLFWRPIDSMQTCL